MKEKRSCCSARERKPDRRKQSGEMAKMEGAAAGPTLMEGSVRQRLTGLVWEGWRGFIEVFFVG
jgi:hypothetical protein